MMYWRCANCGRGGEFDDGVAVVRCGCGHVDTSPRGVERPASPGIVRRLVNFKSAVRRWIAAGRPVRTGERIAELLAICRDCEWQRGGQCLHEDCGCNVNDKSRPLTNKLAMATESCPVGKFCAE
jgi:hypothetical protein